MSNNKQKKNLDRSCVVCGQDLKIEVEENGRYRGGHYFGKLLKEEEYWECEGCYKE